MQNICIGVHVHAEPERLQATLAALERHTQQTFEILLLPDGPDIATRTALDQLCDLPQAGTAEPRGAPACFNRLAASTSADVLVLLESGALVGPGWLDYLLAALTIPGNGLSGPSTNRAWNEQGVIRYSNSNPADVERAAQQIAQQFGSRVRTLEPLYSLSDFCYVVRREVIDTIGAADEAYGLGPCWEMDYNIRAERAGFRCVWACGAYVYRAPFTTRRRYEESRRFEANKHLYQDRFCGLRLRGQKTGYETRCRGEACEHFAPRELMRVTLLLQTGDHSSIEYAHTSGTATKPAQGTAPTEGSAPVQLPVMAENTHQKVAALPLISCIMPTRNRRAFVRLSLAYFERQDYPNLELIILDDGGDRVADLIPTDPRVRYLALPRQLSIGAKRNMACEMARGAIIAHWDDDDWYASHRLSHQAKPLLARQADITGLETSCFFDLNNWQAWICSPALHRRLFVGDVHGSTLMYWRNVWEKLAHFPDITLAEDARFLQQACLRGAHLLKLPHAHSFVYLRHGKNAWHFPVGSYLQPADWQHVDLGTFLPLADQLPYKKLTSAAHAISVAPSRSEDMPLVSCIMPTYNRRPFITQAIAYFLRQDYLRKELIILDDGTDAVGDLVPADKQISYVRLSQKMTVGAKRNLACEHAQGSIIAHWDDDDWHAPQRLRYQIDALLRENTDLCGINQLLFFDPANRQAWQYCYPGGQRVWISGSTLCYKRDFWAGNRFANMNVGEDARFVWGGRKERITILTDANFHIGIIHKGNVSPKQTRGPYWRAYQVDAVQLLLGTDWDFYYSFQDSITTNTNDTHIGPIMHVCQFADAR